MRVWAVLLACACSDSGSSKNEPSPSPPPTPEPTPEPQPEPEHPPEFPPTTRSLELTRTVGVRLEPGDSAKRIGTIAVDTRVGWTATQVAKGCRKPWIEVRPRGWICGDYVKPSTRPPMGREVPYLERGEVVPGIYGKVTMPNSITYVLEKPKKAPKNGNKRGPVTSPSQTGDEPKLVEGPPIVGSVNVRRYDEVVIDNKTYWKVSPKAAEFVLRQAITQHRPSLFGGGRLGDDTGWELPIGFVWPRVYGWQQATLTNKALGGGVARQIVARALFPVLETTKDSGGKPIAYRVTDSEWIAAADFRVFTPAPPPKLLEPNERWIDIDLDTQILVAYEGELAVYATMISSGIKDAGTQTGVYRIWLKESEADMKNLKSEDPYSVATVPWTQFFSQQHELALHSAYWHDLFGTRRSHGCINLAPRDARWLYYWSDPQIPPGWTAALGIPESPGSMVRVRSKEDPDPELKEYAKKVSEFRQQNAPPR